MWDGAACTVPVPESVNVLPAIGRKTQSYVVACRVNFMMPNVVVVADLTLVGRGVTRP